MANTFTCLYYHLIFSTKNREPWLRPEIESRVWSYMAGIACENQMTPIQVGGMPDHVHAVVALPTRLALSDAVKQLKGGSSKWIKDAVEGIRGFAWQDGYAGFTVSKSNLPEVVAYVQNQRKHHRAKTFQEEYVASWRSMRSITIRNICGIKQFNRRYATNHHNPNLVRGMNPTATINHGYAMIPLDAFSVLRTRAFP